MFVDKKIVTQKVSFFNRYGKNLSKTVHKSIATLSCDTCGINFERKYHKRLLTRVTFCSKNCWVQAFKKKGSARVKIEEGTHKKYGVLTSSQAESVKQKAKENNIQKYGVVSTALIPEIRAKQQETMLKNYGVKNIWEIKNIEKLQEIGRIEKYGCHPMQTEEIKDKCMKNRRKNFPGFGISKEEIKFNLFLEEHFPNLYKENQKEKFGQEIDFYLKDQNNNELYIQYDGSYWHPTEEIATRLEEIVNSGNYSPHQRARLNKYKKDMKLDQEFKENNMNLLRIRDIEFKECEKASNYERIVEKIMEKFNSQEQV